MSFIVVIPARFGSSRLPGKPLKPVLGKPLIEHVYRRACESEAKRVIIATDHAGIKQAAQAMNAEVIMTSSSHPSGTDRLAEVVDRIGLGSDECVVNLQGDLPCMPAALINQVGTIQTQNAVEMSTLATPIGNKQDFNNPNIVKVVLDKQNKALYFSRSMIPYMREDELDQGIRERRCLKHIGIYAYRSGFLKQYVAWPVSPMEAVERLEQLRVLWHGGQIKVGVTDQAAGPGVDTAEQLREAETWLQASTGGI